VAGECFEDPTRLYFLRGIGEARAFVLLVDPFASGRYGERLRAAGKQAPTWRAADPAAVLNGVIAVVRQGTNERGGKLDRELAVVLARCDEEGVFDPDDPKWDGRFPPQGRRYDPRLARETGDAVRRHLEEDLEMANLVALAEQNFKRVGYFAASALGAPPREGRVKDPRPRRVEEPLLWILHQWGHL
jgi:hypothetical protein